ncbi:DUF2147 domain-containing protein [Stappia sp. F7233]|uniref:DUF2147 domain-containing protein n=1 Tax=Stappia albiluteola TaxID=2758565 RepID=A0A839AGL9_9HYPH|nr:DUF2147 domain-containing protein [Stappia albiluteola]MBA5778032.1 DUF2147 domain-containing protein [Stappia albiluteola]
MKFALHAARRVLGAAAIGAATLLPAILATNAFAAGAEGVWARPSGSSRIEIASCGNALCGKIIWLKEPRNDVNNPDPAKRANPLLGTQIVLGMVPTGKGESWKGKVYNAEDGKTYTGFITLEGSNKMKLEGCVLGGLICKGETWSRVK